MRHARLIPATLAASALAVVAVLAPVPPVSAGGGDWLEPVRDRYEPGETAVMVGYTVALARSDPGGVDAGPYYGHLRADPVAAAAGAPDRWPFVHPTDVPLGPTTVTETGRRDQFAVRLSITFTVPAGLAPGSYEVFVCDDPCTSSLGFLIGGTLHVGVEPPVNLDRQWLIDDPAVDQLDGEDVVSGIPVARIRSGEAGTPWYDAARAVPPATPPTSATEPPTTAAATAPAPPEADRGDRAAPAEVGFRDAAPWLAAAAAVAGVWRLRARRRPPGRPPEPDVAPEPSPSVPDDALTSARS